MNNIKVSVIIPVYNVEKYLKKCLDSVINQTLKDIEIICVNDASTDKSLEILEQYAKKDNRITIINNKKNSGGGFSRNEALKIAKGEYVSFIDSDDWVDEKMLKYTYNESKLNNLDLIMFLAINYDDSTKEFYESDYYNFKCLKEPYRNKILDFNEIKDFIFCLAVSPVLKLYKKELLDKYNVKFPEGLIFEDTPFFFDIILNANRILVRDDYFYFRRRIENSVMSNINEKHFGIIPITNIVVDTFKKNNYFNTFKEKLLNKKITWIEKEYNRFEGENRSKFLKLIKEDFSKIKEDKDLYNKYKNTLIPLNLEFYLNSFKTHDTTEFDLLNENSHLKSKINNLERKNKNLKKNRDKLKNKNTKLENKNKILKCNLDKVYYSKSWKITKPLRKIISKFR